MNLEPSDEQLALVDAVKSVCENYFSREIRQQLAEDFSSATQTSKDIYEAGWQALEEMGLFKLAVPESDGGVGLGFVESALVFEELGRHLVPGPVLSSFLAETLFGRFLQKNIKSDKEGDIKGTPKIEILDVVSDGSDLLIENPELIGGFLTLNEDGVRYHTDLKISAVANSLDPLTRVGFFENGPLKEELISDAKIVSILRNIGSVLVSAFQLGIADGALKLAVQYAKERQQFGNPIGSFQAVKHICADMLTQVEVARAAVYVAAVALESSGALELEDSHLEDISTARIMASRAASFCGQSCVQVHGGMGYTWEAEPHLFLKRAWALDHKFGSADFHAERLAELL